MKDVEDQYGVSEPEKTSTNVNTSVASSNVQQTSNATAQANFEVNKNSQPMSEIKSEPELITESNDEFKYIEEIREIFENKLEIKAKVNYFQLLIDIKVINYFNIKAK